LSTEQLRAHRGQHAAACHALLQLRPDDVWALSCVINVMLRFDGTVDLSLARRFIELRPNAVESYFTAVRAALASDDSAVASEFAQRGGALDVPLTEENANRVAMLRMFSGATAWLANRPQETLAIVDSVLASVADQARAIQLPFLWYGAYANLMLGRLDEADRLFSLLDAQDARRGRIWVDLERRDPQRLWRTLESGRIDARGRPPVSSPSEWLDAGDLARAQQALTSVSPAGTQHPRVRGELALVEGRPAEAIALLEEVLPRERLSASRLRIARFLARAWVARGDPDRAIQVLEEASNEPRSPLLTAAMMGFLWISVRDQLADLYHSAGRTTDAERVDRELAALLALADDDHPIKRRVQHRH
jgi:tetratricopeptide (TPR) repeat protein